MVVEIINRPGVAWADLPKNIGGPRAEECGAGRIKLNEMETCIRRLCQVSSGYRGYQDVIQEEKSIRRLYGENIWRKVLGGYMEKFGKDLEDLKMKDEDIRKLKKR